MIKQKKSLIFSTVILLLTVLTSCSDHETPSTVDTKAWTSDANIDTSVKPGDDFYNYAVGAWLKANPLSSDENENGANAELDKLDANRFSKMWSNATDDFRKVLYQSRDNSSLTEQNSVNAVKKDLELVEGISTTDELYATIGKLMRKGYKPYFSTSLTMKNSKFLPSLMKGYSSTLTESRSNYTKWIRYCFDQFGYEQVSDDDISNAIENGTLSDWWVSSDKTYFKEKQNMLIKQFDNIYLFTGIHLNGEKTLVENMADLGGLEISYQAFVNKRISEGYKGDELTSQKKKYFLAFAEAWRGNYSDTYLRWQIVNDSHSPSKYRINGIIVNNDDWYNLFSVTKDQKMYLPEENRVHIW